LDRTVQIVLAVGVLAIAGYFIYNATQSGSACSGGIFDAINPACLLSGVSSEVNTLIIVLGVIIVLVVGLLAFGTQTGHLAGAATAALV
jgi:hypothetical protein